MRSLLADSKTASVLEKVSQDVNSLVWYQFIASPRGPVFLYLSCSFQHPKTIGTALHIKALHKNLFFFFPVQFPTACQVAWKAEQLHKMPFLFQAAFKSHCSLSMASFPLKSVGAVEQWYHDEIGPYAFEALPRYSPHLK